jgi:hypothetical protein
MFQAIKFVEELVGIMKCRGAFLGNIMLITAMAAKLILGRSAGFGDGS